MRVPKWPAIVICFLCFCIVSCGFHLRGQYDFPQVLRNAFFVDYGSENDPFIINLKRSLKQSGMHLVDEAGSALYSLHITAINKQSILLASSTTSQVNTYALQFAVTFYLTDKQGHIIMPSQQAQTSEIYTVSSSTVVANTAQEQTLLPELYRDVINQIMMRLSSKNVQKTINNTATAASK